MRSLILSIFVLVIVSSNIFYGQSNRQFNSSFLDSIIESKFNGKKSVNRMYLSEVSEILQIKQENENLQYQILAKWVVNQLDYESRMSTTKSLKTVLRRNKGVCSHYSRIFDSLCIYSGFESYYVSGYIKRLSNSGEIEIDNHAWNAAKINGEIYFTDLTWSDGRKDSLTNRSILNRDFFMQVPEKFILTHYPKDRKMRYTDYSFFKFKRSAIVGRGYFLIDSYFTHNLQVNKKFYNQKEITIRIKKKERYKDVLTLVNLEILPCAICEEAQEVIKLERKDEHTYFLDKRKYKSIEKGTPVILYAILSDDEDVEQTPILMTFFW